jgi:hypothetical protein
MGLIFEDVPGPRRAELLKLGDVVQHGGTKCWATIKRMVPQRDGTSELLVEPLADEEYYKGERWWATYHLCAIRVQRGDPRVEALFSLGFNVVYVKS